MRISLTIVGACTLSSVSAGQVIAQRTGQPPATLSDSTPTATEPVAAMFARVYSAANSKDFNLSRLTFDPNYGYLSDDYSDCGEEGSGEQVTRFKPGSVELESCEEGRCAAGRSLPRASSTAKKRIAVRRRYVEAQPQTV